jgi:diguanylate cyclase (GGDEF)-like protein
MKMTEQETGSLWSGIITLINADERAKSGANLSWLSAIDGPCGNEPAPFASLLRNFIELDFSEEQSIEHWKGILSDADAIARRTGRPVNAITAIVYYFTSRKTLLERPLIVETHDYRQTEQMAMVDSLTGIFNRRYMDITLKKEYNRCSRYGKSFSVCLIDIDDFKRVNDTKGHLFGDLVLRELADLLRQSIREEDVACRYGGEEFLIVIPETNSPGATILADRIRQALKNSEFFAKNAITFSGGTATYPENARDVEALVHAADNALYQAKYSGKDRIISATPERRHYDRFDRSWKLDVFRGATGNGASGAGGAGNGTATERNETHNISLGGVQFESKRKFDLHSNLRMVFNHDDVNGVEARGYITWIKKNREKFVYGVKFEKTPAIIGDKLLQDSKEFQKTV